MSRTIRSVCVNKSVLVDGSTVTKSPREPPVAINVWASVVRFISKTWPAFVLTNSRPANEPVPTAAPSGPPGRPPES